MGNYPLIQNIHGVLEIPALPQIRYILSKQVFVLDVIHHSYHMSQSVTLCHFTLRRDMTWCN